MTWIHAKGVKTFNSPDNNQRVHILERNDGLYEYRAEAFASECGVEYWARLDESGLYESLQEVEDAAIATLPWLRAMMAGKAGDME